MSRLTTFTASAALFSTAFAAQFVMYTPGGDDTAVERADPIISPNAISGHVHQIFGASAFGAELSYDSLQASDCTTVGDASGDGNAADKSSYWHPALYMESSNGTGYVRVPTSGHKLYYRDAGNDADKKADPFEFPKGYRMIAGNPFSRAANNQTTGITQWMCHSNSGSSDGEEGFPSGVTDCDAYPGFNGAIHFPHCWNGEDFDQANPTAHYAYPEGDVEAGPCPSTHPIRLPHIFIENQFDLHSIVDQVKPNTFTLAQGDPTGYGWHMDFFNGWDSGAIPELLKTCPAPYYGNEDIGTCPSFKKMSVKNEDCKLKITYTENVDTPGKYLPGCNPVTSTNPAAKLAVAALGQSTDSCSPAGSGSSGSGSSGSGSSGSGSSGSGSSGSGSTGSSSSGSSSAVPAYSSASESSSAASAPAYEAPSATTMATSVVAATATVYGNPNIVYETQYVTVTARDLPTPVADVHARHGHAMKHIRGRRL